MAQESVPRKRKRGKKMLRKELQKKMQAVAIKAEKHRVWTGAWNEIKRMFAFLAKFVQAKYIGFRLKQKNRRRKNKR
jgi:hypothetical protein